VLRISNIFLEAGESEKALQRKICKKLHIQEQELISYRIYKKSLDARKRQQIPRYQYIVDVQVKAEEKFLKWQDKNITKTPKEDTPLFSGQALCEKPPVVVGFGPGGMFAALTLAQMGLRPIVLEQGEAVDERVETVKTFWETGVLNPKSNVQFGEGGAGTFSDGKLTTRSKDLRCKKVLEELVLAGAPQEILYEHKPHIGTDKLRDVVKTIRRTIEELGGCIRFGAEVTDLELSQGRITGVVINKTEYLPADDVLLCIGHSARDTFQLLYEKGIALEQKPFAMGVRIEHPQKSINLAQYGQYADKLPAADYHLTYQTKAGRGVYTFCMCPGGSVVAAASEEGRLAINGMSEYARDKENANSAVLVQVFPEDFKGESPLAGMEFQRELEEKAFYAGGSNFFAPVQLVGDFLQKRQSTQLGEVKPSYLPNVKFAQMEEIFPPFMIEALREAIPEMGKKLIGFDRDDAILTAVESRSSSPIRILRDTKGESISVKGLYPVGEGAGYAGGIVSAAVDGIAAAQHIFEKYAISSE
jgi:uncharacterized FAD-dependent dehydrogenase